VCYFAEGAVSGRHPNLNFAPGTGFGSGQAFQRRWQPAIWSAVAKAIRSVFRQHVRTDGRTQKPLSSLWKVTRSIRPEIPSVAGLRSGIAAFMRGHSFSNGGTALREPLGSRF